MWPRLRYDYQKTPIYSQFQIQIKPDWNPHLEQLIPEKIIFFISSNSFRILLIRLKSSDEVQGNLSVFSCSNHLETQIKTCVICQKRSRFPQLLSHRKVAGSLNLFGQGCTRGFRIGKVSIQMPAPMPLSSHLSYLELSLHK